MTEFEKPTSRQRIDDVRAAAQQIGNDLPVSIIFSPGGSKSAIGISFPLPQGLEIPSSQDGIVRLEQIDSEGKSKKRKKVQPPMKDNQVRHSENLSGLNGWYNGKYYVNGQPMERKESNTNGSKRNGNGRH